MTRTVLFIFLLLLPAATVRADERVDAGPEPRGLTGAEISELVGELAAADFQTRRRATQRLRSAGESAIGALQSARESATADQRLLIDSILKDLQRNSFANVIRRLEQQPSVAEAQKLPEWSRLQRMTKDERSAIRFYLRMAMAEPDLFAAAARKSAELPALIQRRTNSLLDATVPTPVPVRQWSLDSYAAILFLAGNPQTRLPGATSTAISSLLNYSKFESAVQGEDGDVLLRLVGSYIQRGRIAVTIPLEFARRHRMSEGLQLARDVVRTALRGRNGIPAMMTLLEMGTEEDIPLLESVFTNRRPVFSSPATTPGEQTWSVCNCDLALAVAITLRGRDPRDFGFAPTESRQIPFRFAMDTVGFRSDAERSAAFHKYAAEFFGDGQTSDDR